MKRQDTPAAQRVLDEMGEWLRKQHGIVSLGPLGFENTYALVMRNDRAEVLGIHDLEDLARHSPELRVGGDYEFFARPEWIQVRDRYRLAFGSQRSFDSTLMYTAVVEGHVDVISAFSSDGRIAAFDLRVLDDPLQAFPPYDAVLLVSARASRDTRIAEALRPLVRGISDDSMRRANKLVDLDGMGIPEAARVLSKSIDAELKH